MSEADEQVFRFAVDIMLGKLAKWLRVLGFDASVEPLVDLQRIQALLRNKVIPVTRREIWLGREGVIFIRSDHHFEQVKELLRELNVSRDALRPFSRCVVCNTVLVPIPRELALGSVPDFTFETASDFRKCPGCGRVYWPGTHKDRMLAMLKSLVAPEAGKEENHGGE
jgi:uncharacterized protein with PIN domain